MKISNLFYLISILSLGYLSSCTLETDIPLPGTVGVDLAFALVDEDATAPNARTTYDLHISEATIAVRKLDIRILGKLPLGNDLDRNVNFDFPALRPIVFQNTPEGADIDIVIPRAVYRQFMFDLKLESNETTPAISVMGNISSGSFDNLPIQFEFWEPEFEVDGKFEAKDKNDLLDFDQLEEASLLVELYAKSWFKDISEEKLQNAVLSDGVLLITPDHNPEIYNQIKSSIYELQKGKVMIRIQPKVKNPGPGKPSKN